VSCPAQGAWIRRGRRVRRRRYYWRKGRTPIRDANLGSRLRGPNQAPPASVLTLHLGTAPSRAPFMPQESGIGPPPLLRRHDDFGRFLVLSESRCEPTPAKPASAVWETAERRILRMTVWALTRAPGLLTAEGG
jgi:hypothetical protein